MSQALMGVASVALLYDLVRRRFSPRLQPSARSCWRRRYTLGHAASGTFPAGGPASAASAGFGGGPFGRAGGRSGVLALSGGAGAPPGVQMLGPGSSAPQAPPGCRRLPGRTLARPAGYGGSGGGAATLAGPAGAGGAIGPFGNDRSLAAVVSYVRVHGGGTIAVSSQSSAAAAIVQGEVEVAGIGGFSGRESDVSVGWLAQLVSSGKIRWVLADQRGGSGFAGRLPGDTQAGSKAAMSAVATACKAVTLASSTSSATPDATGTGMSAAASSRLYDRQGRAQALSSAGSS